MNASSMKTPTDLPSAREENWKYANLRALARVDFTQAAAPAVEEIAKIAALLPARLPGYARLVLVDGHPIESLSDLPAALSLRTVSAIERAASGQAAQAAAQPDRHFAKLNTERTPNHLTLSLATGQSAELELICFAARSGHPAVRVQLAEAASLRLIERHLGFDASSVANLHLTLDLQPRATLDHARILQLAPKALQMETLDVTAAERATLNLVQVQMGGQASRANVFVEHRGADACVDWQLAVLAEGQQTHDFYVRTAHAAERAKTSQSVRAIAADRARVGFNGHMIVEPQALGTDSQQSLRALLAGGEAEANLRPQLEIYTDAVTATHGATVGKLDADMLFYLLSRGIDPRTAEDLLKWAFIGDVLGKLPAPQLQRSLRTALAHALPGVAAAETASEATR